MQTFAKLRNPDDAEATITFTLNVRDLKKLCDQLSDPSQRSHWPLETLKRQICEVINKADTVFCSDSVKAPD